MTQTTVTIRDATVADAPGIARVWMQSWRSTYPGLIPASVLVNLSEAATVRRWRAVIETQGPGIGTIVAVDRSGRLSPDRQPGGIVGVASFGAHRTAMDRYAGEIHTLYLLDDAKGLGIGRRMMASIADRLLADAVQSAALWCLADNPACWFYERMGGIRVAERPIRFVGSDLREVAYGWRDLVPLARLSTGPQVR